MVPTMPARPPQRALLHRGAAEECESELEGAAGLVGLVGEVSVVPGGDAEEPSPEEAEAERDLESADAGVEAHEAACVDGPVHDRRNGAEARPESLGLDLSRESGRNGGPGRSGGSGLNGGSLLGAPPPSTPPRRRFWRSMCSSSRSSSMSRSPISSL